MAGNPILHELPPFSLRYPPSLSPGQRQTIYEGQVRAFLEASKDVEIEEEVLNDILDGFGGLDEAGDDMAASETIVHSQKGRHVDAAENIELPLSYGFYIFFGPQGRTDSMCFANARILNHFVSEPMTPRWAKQQINGMVAHLKQRGEYSSCRLRQR
jgi:uncharacterized protein (UPF0335 family)